MVTVSGRFGVAGGVQLGAASMAVITFKGFTADAVVMSWQIVNFYQSPNHAPLVAYFESLDVQAMGIDGFER